MSQSRVGGEPRNAARLRMSLRASWRRTWAYPLVALVLLIFSPILWLVDSAFKPLSKYFVTPPEWLPIPPTLQNLGAVLSNPAMPRYFLNSIVITGSLRWSEQ